MSKRSFKIALSSILVCIFIFASSSFSLLAASNKEKERAALEKELAELEQQIERYEGDINKTQAEKKTLQNAVYVLKTKIQQLDAQIGQSNLMIKDLNLQIGDTEVSIDQTAFKILDAQDKLSVLLRTIYEEDQKSPVEIFLAEDRLSNFLDNLMALELLSLKNKELLRNIKDLKIQLGSHKETLDNERDTLEHLVVIKSLQKDEQQKTQQEQAWLLEETKGKEALYQQGLKETQAKAADIRARIFELIGVSEAPTFGEAYEIAKYVEDITGVRPAFLLAVLTQESSLGKNVGQCYVKNSQTGSGVVAKTGQKINKVMAPGPPYSTRNDIAVFIDVTKGLGRDPYETLVSCPMSYGWGGAMGPAQFIPSTWKIYRDELKSITGREADPWNIRDAFLAAGLYLSKYGAKKQTYDGEFNAALSYFAGPGWYQSYYKNVYQRDYGYPVMNKTAGYEKDIAALEANGN